MTAEQTALLISLVRDRINAIKGIAFDEGLLREQLDNLLEIERQLLRQHLTEVRRITFGG